MIKELDYFINSLDVEDSMHDRMFDNGYFDLLTSKIRYEDYRKELNRVYWLSVVIYRLTFTKYMKSIKPGKSIKLSTDDLIVYAPFLLLSSELCKLLKNKYLYTTLISTIARQIIEQMCIIKEIEAEKINDVTIFEAMIQSYNNHVGGKVFDNNDLNNRNKGILKVFNRDASYGKLAKNMAIRSCIIYILEICIRLVKLTN